MATANRSERSDYYDPANPDDLAELRAAAYTAEDWERLADGEADPIDPASRQRAHDLVRALQVPGVKIRRGTDLSMIASLTIHTTIGGLPAPYVTFETHQATFVQAS